MKETTLIFKEQPVSLSSPELEILLIDVHGHIAALLSYIESGQKQSLIPEKWLRLRMATLKNLAAKLEAAMQIPNEKETNDTTT